MSELLIIRCLILLFTGLQVYNWGGLQVEGASKQQFIVFPYPWCTPLSKL